MSWELITSTAARKAKVVETRRSFQGAEFDSAHSPLNFASVQKAKGNKDSKYEFKITNLLKLRLGSSEDR
jgi:hypothetical protein